MNVPFSFVAGFILVSLFLFGCTGPTQATGNSGGISINTSVKVNGVTALPAATSGQLYNAKIDVSGGSGPYSCSAASGASLPGDLVFSDPGCSIVGGAPILDSGTPSAVYPIQLTVTDSQGNKGAFQLTLVVNQPAPKLLLPDAIDTAEIGKYYEYNFCVPSSASVLDCGQLPGQTSTTSPFTFTVSGQPLGLSMSTNGLLSGTVPDGANSGNYKITVCATDLVGAETCADTILPVAEKPPVKVEECNSPYDGKWAGSVEGGGTNSNEDDPRITTPFSISYTFEMTLKCDYKDINNKGEPLYWENITYAKVSDPFFGCVEGCTPILSYSSSNLDMPAPGTGGEVYFDILFPNRMTFGGAGLKPNADATSFVDEDNTGSGNLGSGGMDSPPYRESADCVPGCSMTGSTMKHYKIEIHKVS